MDDRLSIEDSRRLPGLVDAAWADPAKKTLFVGVDPPENLRQHGILLVNGLYLIETADEPGEWWMGQEHTDGSVHPLGGRAG